MTRRMRTAIWHFIATVIAPLVTVIVAIAGTQTDNFIAQHPDAAQWVMAALVSLTCLLAMSTWKNIVKEQKQMRKDFTEALAMVVKTVGENHQEFIALKQHCDDVERYGIRR